MTRSGQQTVDAAAAIPSEKRYLRRHFLLKHPVGADRARWLLLLAERRAAAAARGSARARI